MQGKGLALDAVFGSLYVEAAMLQVACHQLAHVAVVFDQQDARLHGMRWWSNRYCRSELQRIFSVFARKGELRC